VLSLLRQTTQVLDGVPVDFGGGCSLEKAYLIAWLIRRFRMRATLDIGVYRGRSLLPQAAAHRFYTNGVVYGVDPWSAKAALETDEERYRERISAFVATTNYEAIYEQLVDRLSRLGLGESCRLVRSTSTEALEDFAARGLRFGLIHIDGNHDTQMVTRDVRLCLPLLEPGGFCVMDDISWGSVAPALGLLSGTAREVFRRIDSRDDFAVFKMSRAIVPALYLRIVLAHVARKRPRLKGHA
jgi:predicted O-methyltransferase YrrM